MLATKLLSAMAGGGETLYVDDVFSAYTYTGNGSTQTITNGIDLAGKGGLVWLKIRSPNAYGHYLFDTVRGASQTIRTESTGGQTTTGAPITFNSNGFALAYAAGWNENVSTFVGFTFRKAPKFFDVVTWTGNATNRTISHALGQEVGLIFVKRTDTTADWQVYHRSLANTEYMVLNSTAAKATGATRWNSTTPTTSVFSVGTDATVNASGGTYVAYLFAHDTAADGIVQCGSFTTDGIGNATVNLGWEPQYVMLKQTNAANNWQIFDTSRAFTATYGTAKELDANLNSTEYTYPTGTFKPTATGFQAPVGFLSATATYIYLAIRRPNKPPTVGTQVYNAIARTGTGAAATVTGVGFAPDLVALRSRSGTTGGRWEDRLRGATIEISSNATTVEAAVAQSLKAFGMDGFALGTDGDWNTSAATYISWCFKRAPGVFDQVCYTGTGVAKTEAHGLGVVPELMIVKSRLATGNWAVYNSFEGATEYTFLNTTDASAGPVSSVWNNTAPTTSVFTVGTSSAVNTAVVTYVAYLFATKAGISKVGSYTGNGSSQTIDCGFTTGARFILIKRTDATGDWYVWDTVRGIIAGNDPHLSLNSTAAEVTSDDSIDPASSGFIVNQLAATNINVTGGTFIFLALS